MATAATTPNAYDPGDLVEVSAAFADVNGVATAPANVVCKVRDPLGVITTLSASPGATGVYTAEVDLTNATPGKWFYQFAGIGGCQAAGVNSFYVNESPFS